MNREVISQTLTFKPRARLIRTIGDRLISGPEAAIIELVKNSHDADATYVKVIITPPSAEEKGKILVEDDGHGMTLADIEHRWMEPATTDKIERRTSPEGRTLLGSKGIGRFATARLGRFLELESVARDPDDPEKFQSSRIPNIDWNVFDDVEYLSDVEFSCEVTKFGDKTGTRLSITDLRDDWTEKRLVELHKEMRRLISPVEEADRAEFKIYLDLSAFLSERSGFDGAEIVNGPLAEKEDEINLNRIRPFPLLGSCDYEVDGEFSDKGVFSGTITIHRGGLEKEKLSLDIPIEAGEESCGMVLVHLFIFDRETDALKNAMMRAGISGITAKQARQHVDEVAGVAIYRDRFRIRPYGDNQNDWLTLDTRRVQNPSMRIGHNQVSGILIIGDESSSGLIERSSREGLEENGSYRRLQRLVISLFSGKIEPIRRNFREKAGIDRSKTTPLAKSLESARFKWAEKLIESLPKESRPKAQEVIEKESSKLLRYLEDIVKNQAVLEAKVTLGLIVGEVLHEGRPPVAYLFDHSRILSRWWPSLLENSEEAIENRNSVPRILRGMSIRSEELRNLFRALKPLVGGKRGKPVYYSPNQVIIDTLLLFSGKIKNFGVQTEHRADDAVRDILGYREDLSTAVTNIMDNALFWLDQHKVLQPTVSIDLTNENNGCAIVISDNGQGVPPEFCENIFDVGFTLKPNGTGLGLSIAREAISRSQGTIDLKDSVQGASFRIWLPYAE